MRTRTPEPAGGMQVGARVTLAEGSLGLRAAQKGHLCLSTSGVGPDVGEVVEVDSTSRGSGKLTLKVRASCGGEAWYKEEQVARTKAAFRPSTSCVQWAMSQQGVLENAELTLCRENEMLARQQVSRARRLSFFCAEFEQESCVQVGEERKERQKAEARVRALEAQLAEKEDAAKALLQSVQSKEAAQLKSPPAAAAPKQDAQQTVQKQPVQMEDPKASPSKASPPQVGVAKTPSRSPAAGQGEALAKAERRAAAAEQQLKALQEQQQAQQEEEERKQLDQNWVCPNYMCKNVNCESGPATVVCVSALPSLRKLLVVR